MSSSKVIQGQQKIQILWLVLVLRIALFLVELGVGIWSHSLSLLAGAGHLFSDMLTLGLTLIAAWVIQRQLRDQTELKYRNLSAWVALLNGISLATIALLIGWEALKHLQSPEPVSGLPMLLAAGLSLFINGLSIQLLHGHSHNDLNVRGLLLHGVADAASSGSVILAACTVYFFNWLWADAAGSLMVAVLIGLSAVFLIRDGWQLLKRRVIQS